MAAQGNGNGRGNGPPRVESNQGAPGDRLPPHNLEAEKGVLGSILFRDDVMHEVAQILKVEDFYRDIHQTLYRTIRDLYDLGKAVDTITLAEELTRLGEYDKIGGDETLTQLFDAVPHAANAEYYAQIVHEKAIQRELIQSAHEIAREGYSNTLTADELLELAEKKVYSIAEVQSSGKTVDIRDVVTETMNRIAKRSEEGHPVTGLPTGFFELDEMTSGFEPSQLIIVAARPSMGKTAFALNIAEHVALERGVGVLIVSLEMGQLELGERLLCSRSKVDSHKLKKGQNLGNRELALLGKAYDQLRAAPIFIDDTPTRSMLHITANARRLKMRKNIGLVIVDYIQLVDAENSKDSRQEQIAKISRRLKTLARELQIPVIALSQLNRDVEKREDRRPRMADLRESGAIEQDADTVLLLHRPEVYDANDQPGIAEVIVAKNRSGPTGKATLTFLKHFTRFENHAQIADPIDGSPF